MYTSVLSFLFFNPILGNTFTSSPEIKEDAVKHIRWTPLNPEKDTELYVQVQPDLMLVDNATIDRHKLRLEIQTGQDGQLSNLTHEDYHEGASGTRLYQYRVSPVFCGDTGIIQARYWIKTRNGYNHLYFHIPCTRRDNKKLTDYNTPQKSYTASPQYLTPSPAYTPSPSVATPSVTTQSPFKPTKSTPLITTELSSEPARNETTTPKTVETTQQTNTSDLEIFWWPEEVVEKTTEIEAIEEASLQQSAWLLYMYIISFVMTVIAIGCCFVFGSVHPFGR